MLVMYKCPLCDNIGYHKQHNSGPNEKNNIIVTCASGHGFMDEYSVTNEVVNSDINIVPYTEEDAILDGLATTPERTIDGWEIYRRSGLRIYQKRN